MRAHTGCCQCHNMHHKELLNGNSEACMHLIRHKTLFGHVSWQTSTPSKRLPSSAVTQVQGGSQPVTDISTSIYEAHKRAHAMRSHCAHTHEAVLTGIWTYKVQICS